MISRLGRERTTRVDSERMTSTRRGSLPTSAASSTARAEGVTVARSTLRPSALETIFCAMTSTSRSCNGPAPIGDQGGEVVARLDHGQAGDGEEFEALGHGRAA